MIRSRSVLLVMVALFIPRVSVAQDIRERASAQIAWQDPSPHTRQLITADEKNNVSLEVLDWGGSGRPLVLLAGLGDTAHVFDEFTLQLTPTYHVYGITRRGFGVSSSPPPEAGNYSANRLADDIIAVLDALKIERPILVGHSMAGEELSSIGTRHPEKISALVYLDAAYSYAYYDKSHGDLRIDLEDVRHKLDQLPPGQLLAKKDLIRELVQDDLPQLENDFKGWYRQYGDEALEQSPPVQPSPPTAADTASFATFRSWNRKNFGFMAPEAELRQRWDVKSDGSLGRRANSDLTSTIAIMAGEEKYTDLRVPVLAIYAVPHNVGPFADKDPAARDAAQARDKESSEQQIKALQSGVPSARIVILPNANHYIFLTNEAEVLRDIQSFAADLP